MSIKSGFVSSRGVMIEEASAALIQGLPYPQFHCAADLSFTPDDWLPGGAVKARLLVSRYGDQTYGSITMGHGLLTGKGEFVRFGDDAMLRLDLLSRNGPVDALSLAVPVATGAVRGTFAAATPIAMIGGLLDVYWWQNGDPWEDCGDLLSQDVITAFDPEGTNSSQFALLRYERCDIIAWLKDGELIKDTVERLARDNPNGRPYRREGVEISTGNLPLSGSPVGSDRRSGLLRVFYMTGCTNPRVTQYDTHSKFFTAPPEDPNAAMPEGFHNPWHLDGVDPYSGATTHAGTGDVISTDIPAVYESVLELAEAQNPVPAGTTITFTWTFETFFRCDDVLIGWVRWGLKVVFTKGDEGKLTRGAPQVDPPQFHGPESYSESAGNPKPN